MELDCGLGCSAFTDKSGPTIFLHQPSSEIARIIERPEAPNASLSGPPQELQEMITAGERNAHRLEQADWIGTVFTKETSIGEVSQTVMMRNIGNWGQASSITSKVANMLAYAKTLEIMKNKLKKTSDFYLPSHEA